MSEYVAQYKQSDSDFLPIFNFQQGLSDIPRLNYLEQNKTNINFVKKNHENQKIQELLAARSLDQDFDDNSEILVSFFTDICTQVGPCSLD